MKTIRIRNGLAGGLLILVLFAVIPAAWAQEAGAVMDVKVALDTVWTLIAAFLVMFMALGFSMLESGFCRAKNTVKHPGQKPDGLCGYLNRLPDAWLGDHVFGWHRLFRYKGTLVLNRPG